MDRKIVAYTLVEREKSAEVDETVTRLLGEGFQPLGGISVATAETEGGPLREIFAQAMVRYN